MCPPAKASHHKHVPAKAGIRRATCKTTLANSRLLPKAKTFVDLPARQLTRISIDLTGEVQKVADYLPDAGISARDVVVDGDSVRVTVHNIGTVDVENLTVALYDGEKALEHRVIQNLEAPLDLLPRTQQVAFSIGSDMPDSIAVVLDPDIAVSLFSIF